MDLIGTYSNYIRQQQPGGTIIKNNLSITSIIMIDPATGWFEIIKFPMYDLNEVTDVNTKYIDN